MSYDSCVYYEIIPAMEDYYSPWEDDYRFLCRYRNLKMRPGDCQGPQMNCYEPEIEQDED